MIKPVLRILSFILLLCLLRFPGVLAEEAHPQVVIAIDSGDNRSMLPLAGVLAYQAEQTGSFVSVVDLFHPEKPAVYSTGCGSSIADRLEGYTGERLTDDKKMEHLCGFLKDFFTETVFSPAATDVYILSGYEREIMVSGKWDENKSTFNVKALRNAHSSVSAAMDANPQLRLHFIYGSSKENAQSKLDEQLLAQYPDRVALTVMQNNAADPAAISAALFSGVESYAQTSRIDIPSGGKIAYRSTGLYTMLKFEFSEFPAPTSIVFIPEGQEFFRIPAFCDTLGRFWLLLPENTPNGSIMFVDDKGEAYDALYSLLITTALNPGSLDLTGDAGQLYMPGQQAALVNDKTRLTLTIDQPGFEQSDFVPSLVYVLHENGAESAEVQPLTLTPDDVLANTWHAELPAMAINTTGELRTQYTLWDKTLGKQVYPFTVENRAPMLRDGVEHPICLTAYYEIPGKGTAAVSFNLGEYFTDPDVSDHLSAIPPQTGSRIYSCTADAMQLSYTANQASAPFDLDIVINDMYGASAECRLNVEHVSVKMLIDALKMEFPKNLDVPINTHVQYDLVLPADVLSPVVAAFEALNLPPVTESLRIFVNEETHTLTAAEDGSLVLSIPVDAADRQGETTITLRAELALPDTAPVALDSLFPASQFTVRFTNYPPRLQEGANATLTCEADISGFPGSYKSIRFDECFGAVIPSTLFANDETEALTYLLAVPKDLVRVNNLPAPAIDPQDSTRMIYSFSGEAADLPLSMDLLAPGDITIELTVMDSGSQYADQAVRYHATLQSVFTRITIIVGICALVLAAAAAAVLLLLRQMRPAFDGAIADISVLRTRSEDRWLNPQTFTSIPLSGYGKNPVSLMNLLTASGQLPPRDCDASVLTHISFSPEKDGSFRVVCSGSAAQNAVSLYVDGTPAEVHAHFSGDQELSVRFTESALKETLFIRMYRR